MKKKHIASRMKDALWQEAEYLKTINKGSRGKLLVFKDTKSNKVFMKFQSHLKEITETVSYKGSRHDFSTVSEPTVGEIYMLLHTIQETNSANNNAHYVYNHYLETPRNANLHYLYLRKHNWRNLVKLSEGDEYTPISNENPSEHKKLPSTLF